MTKYIYTLLFLSLSLTLQAREINPAAPDFNHKSCRYILGGKTIALEKLVALKSRGIENQINFQQLTAIEKTYFYKLSGTVRSTGKELYSFELDKQLDLTGDCDTADALIGHIIRTLD